jgi:precorrin-6Y C5,15-methyltransferase (decarboxylating)
MSTREISNTVAVVGLGVSPDDLSERQREVIHGADLLVGGRRHLSFFRGLGVHTLEIDRNLGALVEEIENRMEAQKVVVLASGDPLFYGIGAFLIRRLGRQRVRLYSNATAASAAFARIGEPWRQAAVLSLHGRCGQPELLTALREKPLVAVYTDPQNTPAQVARLLLARGVDDVDMCVCEDMGLPTEKIRWLDLEQAAENRFSDLNVVIFKQRESQPPPGHPGMPDDFFEHQQGLITKAEIRAVSLARLGLQPGQTLWDLGAGSGSVALEASLLLRNGTVWAVEKNPRRIAHIENNRRRLRAWNVGILQADLPAGLEKLPDPDRVFIGGGGRRLSHIIADAAKRLPADGIMVINVILLHSLQSAMEVLEERGFAVDMVQLQVNRQRSTGPGIRLAAENPVFILSARRRIGEETDNAP